jgi:CheY-like chemotaxis protein
MSSAGGAVVDQEAFRGLVREALAHLYEPAHVLSCRLARLLTDAGLIQAPEQLARYLTEAIDELRPPAVAPRGSAGWRQYRYLYLRYVEAAGHRRIADDLGLSTRQATREHEGGLQALSSVLWSRYAATDRPATARQRGTSGAPGLDDELIELGARQPAAPTRLRDVVDGAVSTVSRMASTAGVDLRSDLGEDLRPVVASKQALRHILLGLLDYLIRRSPPGAALLIGAEERSGVTDLLVSVEPSTSGVRPSDHAADQRNGIELARRLAGLQGIQLDVRESALAIEAALALPTVRARTVLSVDDNPDMGRLFRQYVAGTGYGLIHVRTAERAVQVARRAPPDVIVLDVLLPTEDGWQLLERLRADPETATTPVIVCSILPEANLAASLGVAAFLAKPISQPALLAALARCCPLG